WHPIGRNSGLPTFRELMTTTIFLDPDSYANSAGVASDIPRIVAPRIYLVSCSDLSSAVGKRLDYAPSEGPLELAVGVDPSSRSRADCASVAGRRNSSRKSFPRRAELAIVRQCDLVNV